MYKMAKFPPYLEAFLVPHGLSEKAIIRRFFYSDI